MAEDKQVDELIRCLRALSRGDENGPMGMEAITIALGGKVGPGEISVAGGLYAIADAIKDFTVAFEIGIPNLMEAVNNLKK